MPSRGWARRRGYTLIELMAVVAMIGIVAALAVTSYRKWLAAARTGETKDLMALIAQGQHMYKLDTGGYLSCSESWTDWYPAEPNSKKRLFHDTHDPRYPCWSLLAPSSTDPIMVGFSVRAGTASDAPPQPLLAESITWPTPTGPWFIIHAAANQDEDSTYAYWVTSSFQPGEVLSENELE